MKLFQQKVFMGKGEVCTFFTECDYALRLSMKKGRMKNDFHRFFTRPLCAWMKGMKLVLRKLLGFDIAGSWYTVIARRAAWLVRRISPRKNEIRRCEKTFGITWFSLLPSFLYSSVLKGYLILKLTGAESSNFFEEIIVYTWLWSTVRSYYSGISDR